MRPLFLVFLIYFSLNAQIASTTIDELISIISSKTANSEQKLESIEMLKNESIRIDVHQKKALLDLIPQLPLNLSASLTKWLIDSEKIDDYDQFKESLFFVIINALENNTDNPNDLLSLLNGFIIILVQKNQTSDYSEKEKSYLLALGEAFYRHIEEDKSDKMLKALLHRPSFHESNSTFLAEEKLEIWEIQTPYLSNLIFLIRHQTKQRQKNYNMLLLRKIQNMSDTIYILTVLNLFNNNLDLMSLFRKDEIDILVKFMSHKDKTVSGLSKELLYRILHIDRTVDVIKWWTQNRENFNFNSYIKTVILNPNIKLNERNYAICQLCAFSDLQESPEDINFLLKIANDKNGGDIRGSAAFAVKDYIATENLVQLLRDFSEQKYWQRMAMYIIANTKSQFKDKSIEEKIKQILCDNKEEERTRIYYALPALSKITDKKKATAIFILDLVEQNPGWKDKNSPNTLQIPVYKALQSLIDEKINNDLIVLRKAVSEMPDDPPEKGKELPEPTN